MTKIVYSLCGVGLGHSSRSMPVIEELVKQNHELFLISYWNAFDTIKKKFENNENVKLFNLLENQPNSRLKLELYDIPIVPKTIASNFLKLAQTVKKFQPEIIISDYEICSSIIGFIQNIPVVLISNVHLSEYHKINLGIKDKIGYLLERTTANGFPRIDRLLLLGFAEPKTIPENVEFFFHPIRKEIMSLTSNKKGFFLVYFSPKELKQIIPLLKKFSDKKFRVYGAKKDYSEQNLDLRCIDEKKFSNDLANCNGVLTHGGISLICEAIYLKKPIYCFSSKLFFERYYNSKLVQEKKIGTMEEKPSIQGLSQFFTHLDFFEKHLQKTGFFPENQKIVNRLKKIFKEKS